MTAPGTTPTVTNAPLNWNDIEVIRVRPGETFNLSTWAAGDGQDRRYLLDVIDGRLAVEGNHDFY